MNSRDDAVVVAAAVRTPLGRLMGDLAAWTAPQLGAHVIRAALDRAGVSAAEPDEVIMGCVLPAGLGQAPARQAARGAGLLDSVGATTVNKVCGSGMKAAMLAFDQIRAGAANLVVAGGMESMSNAPFLLGKARAGYRVGHDRLLDHLMLDGLEDAYEVGKPMGLFGEMAADAYHLSRRDQDAFAMETLLRARAAIQGGHFADEIVPVTIGHAGKERVVFDDEHPMRVVPDKIPSLKPAFRVDGTITAASSSVNADGAAALILTTRVHAERAHMPILAEVRAHATHSQEPAWYTTAPIPAIRKVLEKAKWAASEVDLYEINEAFAVVPMAAAKELEIPRERLNVNGGACALGHPIGASGARVIVTLIHALRNRGLKKGVAAVCIGGGEATAIAVERA